MDEDLLKKVLDCLPDHIQQPSQPIMDTLKVIHSYQAAKNSFIAGGKVKYDTKNSTHEQSLM